MISYGASPSLRYSDAKVNARVDAFKDGLFEWVPNSRCGKVRCTTCTGQGPSGYGFLGGSWMDKHLAGHTTCPCGRVIATPVLKLHQAHHVQ